MDLPEKFKLNAIYNTYRMDWEIGEWDLSLMNCLKIREYLAQYSAYHNCQKSDYEHNRN